MPRPFTYQVKQICSRLSLKLGFQLRNLDIKAYTQPSLYRLRVNHR
jgi:hypothetical protein